MQISEPEIPSVSPTWVAGIQVCEPPSDTFQA